MINLREEFEKLPEIKDLLLSIKFSAELNSYETNDFVLYGACGFINGAWYAFQEQKKKIDDILNLVCKLQYSSGDRIFKEVKELLK